MAGTYAAVRPGAMRSAAARPAPCVALSFAMLRAERHGDVTRLVFSSATSRSMRFDVSAYAVRGVLVDTGFPRVARDLARWIAGTRPRGAMVTHYHEDHAGNVATLAAHGVPIAMPADTATRVRAPLPIGWYRRWCWGAAPAMAAPAAPFEDAALRLVPARGHSPDHHVVCDEASGTVFGGDLFIGIKVRYAHPGEDVRAQVDALRAVARLGPARYFDAHRGRIHEPVPQLLAKAEWLEESIAAIERLAGEGRSETAIRDVVLGRPDLFDLTSRGDYAKLNFVRSVLRSTPGLSRE